MRACLKVPSGGEGRVIIDVQWIFKRWRIPPQDNKHKARENVNKGSFKFNPLKCRI